MESIILIYMVSLSCRTSRSEAVVTTSPIHGVHYSDIHGRVSFRKIGQVGGGGGKLEESGF